MLRYVSAVLLLTACMSPHDTPSVSEMTKLQPTASSTVTTAAPARDGNIAILEEYTAAKRKNTVEAYGLFIARHPEHELVVEAKALLLAARAQE